MGNTSTAAEGVHTEPAEADVIAYLKAHPDFLTRHPELLELLELRHASGPAVSLIERQVEILRGRNLRLEDRLKALLDAARDNERRAGHVHRLARALIRAPTLAAAIRGLERCMREDFGVEFVFVGVQPPALTRQDIEGLHRLDARNPVVKTFGNFFRTRVPECGPLAEDKAGILFPLAAPPPRSAAIVPLEKEKCLGMLVLASRDAQRFQPGQGKLFLDMVAELVSAALRARLS